MCGLDGELGSGLDEAMSLAARTFDLGRLGELLVVDFGHGSYQIAKSRDDSPQVSR